MVWALLLSTLSSPLVFSYHLSRRAAEAGGASKGAQEGAQTAGELTEIQARAAGSTSAKDDPDKDSGETRSASVAAAGTHHPIGEGEGKKGPVERPSSSGAHVVPVGT